MAKPEACSSCKKPATIHLTQIINNEVKKIDFCDTCPHQKALNDSEGFAFPMMLADASDLLKSGAGQQPSCPSCGFTQAQFKKQHRLGCPDCYEALSPMLQPIIAGMQSGQSHAGKVPEGMATRLHVRKEIESAEEQLREAIAREDFEQAATLRDRIRQMRKANQASSDF